MFRPPKSTLQTFNAARGAGVELGRLGGAGSLAPTAGWDGGS